ncbi:epoxide hydrolase, soluble (sEH) [Mucor velutinosus]|uniref:Epoxide hydrolase, soluble (SEH) n=1 Tax=Mucor velutinosus TaxID=708070 RepID=A0AAN7D3Y6_9FUNG|nr:epoxide hydrolase, soluble (sEH) [Mucor velutinosus]
MTKDTGQQPSVLHKGCNSASCCSPAKLWRTLQSLVKGDDKKELIKFFKDDRLEHIVRVALTSRITNDAALYPPSQQHKVIRLTATRESMLCLGKSFTDLNLLQLALMTSSESTVMALLAQLKLHATPAQLKHFINHVWGQGNTSLHLAVFLKRHLVVKALLDLGCLSDVSNARNKRAVDCCFGDQAILDLLLCHNNKEVQPVVAAAKKQRTVDLRKDETVCHAPPTIVEQPKAQLILDQPLPTKTEPLLTSKEDAYAHISDLACLYHGYFLSTLKHPSSSFVQPNQCVPLAQLKKPPDIIKDYATFDVAAY